MSAVETLGADAARRLGEPPGRRRAFARRSATASYRAGLAPAPGGDRRALRREPRARARGAAEARGRGPRDPRRERRRLGLPADACASATRSTRPASGSSRCCCTTPPRTSPPADLDRMDEPRRGDGTRPTDIAEFLRLDREFHMLSYAGAETLMLGDLVRRLWNTTQPYRRAYTTLVDVHGQRDRARRAPPHRRDAARRRRRERGAHRRGAHPPNAPHAGDASRGLLVGRVSTPTHRPEPSRHDFTTAIRRHHDADSDSSDSATWERRWPVGSSPPEYDVIVWNRSPHAAETPVAAGATLAATAAEALAAPISFSMFADDAAAEAVLTASQPGRCTRSHPRQLGLDQRRCRRPARAACIRPPAWATWPPPVLGRPAVAAAGNLNIMVAGADDLVERVIPLLEHLSVRVWRFGDRPRRANVVKVSVNLMILHALQAIGESITLVEAHEHRCRRVHRTHHEHAVRRRRLQRLRPDDRRASIQPCRLHDGARAEGPRPRRGTRRRRAASSLPTAPVLRERFERALDDRRAAGPGLVGVAEVTRGR